MFFQRTLRAAFGFHSLVSSESVTSCLDPAVCSWFASPLQLETTQAEQISVEHVAKATPTDGTSASGS